MKKKTTKKIAALSIIILAAFVFYGIISSNPVYGLSTSPNLEESQDIDLQFQPTNFDISKEKVTAQTYFIRANNNPLILKETSTFLDMIQLNIIRESSFEMISASGVLGESLE